MRIFMCMQAQEVFKQDLEEACKVFFNGSEKMFSLQNVMKKKFKIHYFLFFRKQLSASPKNGPLPNKR